MWLGFLIPTVLHAINSLHYYSAAIPELNIRRIDLNPILANNPWRAARPLQLTIYPMGVGIGYLLSRDISYSLWFWYFLGKLQAVAGSLAGLTGGGSAWARFPLLEEQNAGALLMLTIGGWWVARGHFRRVWREAAGCLSPQPPLLEPSVLPGGKAEGSRRGGWGERHPSEVLSHATAFWGLVAGFAGIVLWWRAAGLSVGVAAAQFGLWFMFAIALSRLVCEGGTFWIATPMQPQTLLVSTFGFRAFAARDMLMEGYTRWMGQDWRCLMMPNVVSSFKLCEHGELSPRGLAAAIMASSAVALGVSFCTVIWQAYHLPGGGIGLSTWRFVGVCQEPFAVLQSWTLNPPGPQSVRTLFLGVGAAVMLMLQTLRAHYVWWPLHPLGYPVSGTYAMQYMWASCFIAWALKSLVLRYGGVRVYERSRSFFLGMILGDFVMIAFWLVVEMFTGVRDHFLYP